jgi:FkbM family methyltransferase
MKQDRPFMFDRGGYELDPENVRVVLLTTWFVKGLFSKAVYLYFTALLFLSGLVEPMSPRAYSTTKRLADLAAGRLTVESYGTRFKPLDFLSIPIVAPVFERWAWKYLSLRRGDVFLDLGAHIGKYSCIAAGLVGERGRVVAIEPHHGNFRALVRNLELNKIKNVVALNLAAYDQDGLVELFEGANSSGRSSIKLNDGVGSEMVRARALDGVPEVAGLERIDLVKVDVEGAEWEAISGMKGILRAHKPRLLIEVWEIAKMKPLLLEIGYTSFELDPHNRGYYFVSG